MKGFRFLLGYIINMITGFICYPVLLVGITNILGTAKGTAYTIQEPELSAYRSIGISMLVILIFAFLMVQILIKVFLFRNEKKHFFLSVVCCSLSMLMAVFLVK